MNTQLNPRYFTEQGLVHALNVFNFPEDHDSRKCGLAFRYLFVHSESIPRRRPSQRQIAQKLVRIFEENLTHDGDRQLMYEIADILSTHISGREGRRLINRLREFDERERRAMIVLHQEQRTVVDVPQAAIEKTVYADTQNVHNTKVNQSVLNATKTLYKKYEVFLKSDHRGEILENIQQILMSKYPQKTELIRKSIKYIKQSVATFRIGITLADAFKSVWLWIVEHEHSEELHIRLMEELKEMKGFCTTGHLARIVNVIQGFTEEKELVVTISDVDQCNAVVRHFLSKQLAECQDESVIDGMTDGTPEYINFLKQTVETQIPKWEKEYGEDFTKYVPSIVNEFAHVTVYKIEIAEEQKEN
jgi:hypothetical protein